VGGGILKGGLLIHLWSEHMENRFMDLEVKRW